MGSKILIKLAIFVFTLGVVSLGHLSPAHAIQVPLFLTPNQLGHQGQGVVIAATVSKARDIDQVDVGISFYTPEGLSAGTNRVWLQPYPGFPNEFFIYLESPTFKPGKWRIKATAYDLRTGEKAIATSILEVLPPLP